MNKTKRKDYQLLKNFLVTIVLDTRQLLVHRVSKEGRASETLLNCQLTKQSYV